MRSHIIILSLFSMLAIAPLQGQLAVESNRMEFGTIVRGSERIQEVYLVNKGAAKEILLRTEHEIREYDVKYSTRSLEPGDSLWIRVKLNPLSKGSKKDELDLLFASSTITIKLSAEVEYVDPSGNTPCPDFTHQARNSSTDWQAYFKVIDRESKRPIAQAEVLLQGMNGRQYTFKSDRNGEVLTPLPIDFYTIRARKQGYSKFSLESYINRRNKDFTLELMPGEMGSVVVLKPGAKDKEEIPAPEPSTSSEEERPVKEELPVTEEESEFSLNEFKPNNVVFLVDVSTSMRQQDRIGLLKSSMKELATMLRPQDIISIVTYATSTDVIISGEHVRDSERITEVIEALEAEGKTAGEAGLKQAYSICQKHFIDGGNNHIFLATDGAFNKGTDKVHKLARIKARRGMQLSVLSIRSSKWVDKKMAELATAGEGTHLSLQEQEEAGQLKELIKAQSKR